MSEEHLDLLSFATRDGVGLGLCDRTGLVASGFMNRARDFACRNVQAALGLERAGLAVLLARKVDHRAVLRQPVARLGFGSSWNAKPNALEVIAAGCNNTVLFLDEMSLAKADAVDAVMRLTQGQGKARYTELHRLSWCMPLLSTANGSILAIMRKLGDTSNSAAYIDRLMDVPPPDGCDCYFENLHGARDVAEYCGWMDGLANQHHGRIGYWFALKFALALRTDREGWKAFFSECRDEYIQAAADITATGRDLTRVHGRNATIYAAARLATRFGVFPVAEKDLLEAVLTCERDHVAFVANEERAAAEMQRAPFDRLKDYVAANKGSFADVQDPEASLPEDHDHERCPGYIGVHRGQREYWLTQNRFEKIAGGKREANRLKADLLGRRLIATEPRGDNKLNFVVKRQIPGLGRKYVVAMIPGGKRA